MSGRAKGIPSFMWKQHPDVSSWVVENRHIGLDRLADGVAERFPGYPITRAAIKGFLGRNGLTTGEGSNHKGVHRLWTPERLAYLESHGSVMAKDLAVEMSERFGVTLTTNSIEDARCRFGIRADSDGRFEKGHIGGNRFRKGHDTPNKVPLGSRTLKNGYEFTKVDETPYMKQSRAWRQTHVIMWEKTYGPVPEGKVVIFVNNDRTDIRLDNLMLVDRGEAAGLRKYGVKELGNRELIEARLANMRLMGEIDGKLTE